MALKKGCRTKYPKFGLLQNVSQTSWKVAESFLKLATDLTNTLPTFLMAWTGIIDLWQPLREKWNCHANEGVLRVKITVKNGEISEIFYFHWSRWSSSLCVMSSRRDEKVSFGLVYRPTKFQASATHIKKIIPKSRWGGWIRGLIHPPPPIWTYHKRQ